MPTPTSNAYLILAEKCFYDDDGKIIDPSTKEFTDWLHNNDSFRVVAGEDSYRARKELYSGIPYFYAVKKVLGKLHKRFISKPEDVNCDRLLVVAANIRLPSAKSPPVEKPLNEQSQLVEEIAALKTQIAAMQEHLIKLVEMSDKESSRRILELEEIKRKYDQMPQLIFDLAMDHLKNFRLSHGADSKELYQRRLTSFLKQVFDKLQSED